QIPCNRRGFVLFYYGAVNYSLSFDARGCDTLGCIATQRASVSYFCFEFESLYVLDLSTKNVR
ncbi:hypothetical protein, partial [uncultured Streptococcus sp.]|uniref:hypothetical protein n=1 Tax=uncultured Streptococcus sp. TaxID=83427 RepID=UPI00280B6AB4